MSTSVSPCRHRSDTSTSVIDVAVLGRLLVAAATVEVLVVRTEEAPAPLLHASTVKAAAALEDPSGHLLSTRGVLSLFSGLRRSLPHRVGTLPPPPAGLMAKGDRGGEDRRDSRLSRGERRIFYWEILCAGESYVCGTHIATPNV